MTFPVADDMDLRDYACLLRDAARAAAASWAEPVDRIGRDRAVRHLGTAVRDLRIVLARMAGRFRLSAMAGPDPTSAARAVAVTASMRALGQAWLLIEGSLPAEAGLAYDACVPGDLLCFTAKRAVTWRMPVTGLGQVILPLADTLAALKDGTSWLAAGDARPSAAGLIEAGARLEAAENQLRSVPQPAVPAARAHAGRPGSLPCARLSWRRRQAW